MNFYNSSISNKTISSTSLLQDESMYLCDISHDYEISKVVLGVQWISETLLSDRIS